MKLQASKESENLLRFFDSVEKLADECDFCKFFCENSQGERREFLMLARHCFTSHYYEAQQIDNALILELR
jgi:hypothetical protein